MPTLVTPEGPLTETPAILAFIADKVDMTWPHNLTVPLLKDVKDQKPDAVVHFDFVLAPEG